MMERSLTPPVRLITGCSSGLGEAIALGFASRGDVVIATMRDPEQASEALKQAVQIECVALDVTDAGSRRSALDQVLNRHGRVDTLVNNAGIVATFAIEDTPENVSRQIFDTNFFGPLALIQTVLPIMRNQGGGRIVNVTAVGAIVSTPLLGIYCASKHALDCLSAVVDIEGRPFGVRSPSVLPGHYRTPIMSKGAPVITAPYQGISDALQRARASRAADVLDDLTSLTDAVIAAATDPEPKPRYLAGIGQLTEAVEPAIAELDRLDDFTAWRCGVEKE